MNYNNTKLLDAADMSEDIASEAYEMLRRFNGSVQIKWSGTSPLGSFKLQATNVPADRRQESDWVDVEDSDLAVSADVGNEIIEIREFCSGWLRVVYTADEESPGEGSVDAWLVSKGWH